MPVFFQHQINEQTRLGIWKIEETEEFFKNNVPQHRNVTHPHKRLQHLAGRFLLQFLFPDFPYELIKIADTRKPFLPNEKYHFSISHCGDYAAAIVSKDKRVGIDIEVPVEKILKIQDKFLSAEEIKQLTIDNWRMANKLLTPGSQLPTPVPVAIGALFPTLLWSCKEAVFKWYGDGGVDFKEHIHLKKVHEEDQTIECFFEKNDLLFAIRYRLFDHLVLAWVMS